MGSCRGLLKAVAKREKIGCVQMDREWSHLLSQAALDVAVPVVVIAAIISGVGWVLTKILPRRYYGVIYSCVMLLVIAQFMVFLTVRFLQLRF